MSKTKDKKDYNKKLTSILITILTILTLLSTVFVVRELIKLNNIENNIRYIIIGILTFITILNIIYTIRTNKKIKRKENKKSKKLFISFLIIYFIITLLTGLGINYFYKKLTNVNKEYVTYTSDLIVLSSNKVDKISKLKDTKIGILNNKKNPDGYIIPMEIVKENNLEDYNNLEKYDDYNSMIVDLYDKKIDAAFVPGNYISTFSTITGYENIANDTKILFNKSKKLKKASVSKTELASSGKEINEPFTLLLMGIDSTEEILTKNAIANGDTLIVITFNPKTLNATILSIPRDSYVPIACWPGKERNKITHAASYGTDCMINTIENYLGLNIDYYAKINFKGLVKLVDAVGGVEVDVKQTLCTDDSSRGGQVCIKPGKQTLNGEQALVFARNRKQLVDGDFGRAKHQQEIVIALMEKAKGVKDAGVFMNIVNTISNSMDTNLTTKQMLSFYNIGKDILKATHKKSEIVNIQQLYLAGQGKLIYDKRMRMKLYNYLPNKYSHDDIVNEMKINLNLIKPTPIKEFSFSINSPYEKKVIGEGPYKTDLSGLPENNDEPKVPNFIGQKMETAKIIASKNNINISFVGTSGTVISQSIAAGKEYNKHMKVILTLKEKEKTNDIVTDSTQSNNNQKPKPTETPTPRPTPSASPTPSTEENNNQ